LVTDFNTILLIS